MQKVIPVMFCYDTNYVIQSAVAFYSLMEHANPKYNYKFYILHSDITDKQQEMLNSTVKQFKNCELNFINMQHKFDKEWNECYRGDHFSKEVMYKLLTASIFPQYDKIVVSDVDVVFLGDISPAYFSIDEKKDKEYIAGVKPIGKLKGYLQNYSDKWSQSEIDILGETCGGFLVMNLKRIREENVEQKFIQSLKDNSYRLNQMEQDILNIVCEGRIKHLPLGYVACSYMWDYYKSDNDFKTDVNYTEKEIRDAMESPIQLHYATSIKPWKNVDCTLSATWFTYLAKTPFMQEFYNQLPYKIIIPNERLVQNQGFIAKKESLYRRIANKIPYSVRLTIKHPSIILDRRNWKRLFRKIFKKNFSYIIFDDVFPSNLSPFRYTEFMEYSLDNLNTYVATTGSSLPALKEKKKIDEIIAEFVAENPIFDGKIYNVSTQSRNESLNKLKTIINPVAIFVFQQNIINDLYDNLSFLEENNIPFIFTLYPGGGLSINDKKSINNLKRIFSSKCFRKVIVTQDNVRDYLLQNNFCSEDKIEFIFGVVTPVETLSAVKNKHVYYPDKKTFDVCFVAHKYCEKGKDKGYDVFIETAKKLVKESNIDNIRFTVVGNFNKDDINISDIEDKVKFYGVVNNDDLNTILRGMDIIVSPTKPFVLSKGSFDGFPTQSTTNAILNGVLAIVTDSLNLNNGRFVNNNDLIIVDSDSRIIYEKITELYNNPSKLVKIAKNGQKKAKKIYSIKKQVLPRIRLIKKISKDEYKR